MSFNDLSKSPATSNSGKTSDKLATLPEKAAHAFLKVGRRLNRRRRRAVA